MHVTLHLSGNETTFPETCLLSDYERARYQNAKKATKGSNLGKRTLPRTCLLGVFKLITI